MKERMSDYRIINPRVEMTARDALSLLKNVIEHDQEHGSLDANNTTSMLIDKLSFKVRLDKTAVESALYCCNMLDEKDPSQFWHPQSLTFDQFCRKLLPKDTFDKTYNCITPRETKDV